MNGAKVGWHLMPILVGPQGEGKSYFIDQLISPLRELTRQTDFKALTDDRNIELWSSSILFLDEMSYASRSDVEAVKHVITADTLDRRPMRTNGAQQVRQCATLIGASNKEVEENIRDETGARRFFGLRFKRPPEGYLQKLDWSAAWQSVKHTDADPLEEYRSEVAQIQAASRYRSPVEDWIDNLGEYSAGTIQAGEKLRIKDLYDDYLSHRRAVTGDRDPVSKTMDQFSIELGRLLRNAGEDAKLTKEKDRKGAVYVLRGPSALRAVK
ncbi:virulence-associated E family protein [Sphingobium yanoikuyae]|uniref:Virulence-associated E family protein n=1 Tax=Sphingobium yanoikuyae TaxID=13690 RepID=A0AA42X0A8_SPHYA|nr:VapE domain-containing protein [Sphingobium yanoikuyae]MDH2135125.1 virulence-associated E family protein [Sphingobium yanoikuyae]MDH2153116.1 virulence-associated E family protein [Sphingobium yanoikuyae]MDH2170484.1 virulence-associated E family protein [Sphingobium yanoikuyae]